MGAATGICAERVLLRHPAGRCARWGEDGRLPRRVCPARFEIRTQCAGRVHAPGDASGGQSNRPQPSDLRPDGMDVSQDGAAVDEPARLDPEVPAS